jgi:methionine sulfoxide reductase heme-binding subunit
MARGVRHVATLAGYLSYGLMAVAVCFGILTTTGWARRSVTQQSLSSGHMVLAVMALTFGNLHEVAYAVQTGQRFSYLMVVLPFAQGGEVEVALGHRRPGVGDRGRGVDLGATPAGLSTAGT